MREMLSGKGETGKPKIAECAEAKSTHQTGAAHTMGAAQGTGKPKLLDEVRRVLRFKHYSIRTGQAYVDWIRRYMVFHSLRHPREMGGAEVSAFLTHLAVERNVSASTQNQSLAALLFLHGQVLGVKLPWLEDVERAKRPVRLPVVLTQEEARRVLGALEGSYHLMGTLLYGSGLRLLECLRLRVKDVDFGYLKITVRDGKGAKDRVTMLPVNTVPPLREHLEKVRALHAQDVEAGNGRVMLPDAMDRKSPNAALEWGWQWVFPAAKLSTDPRSGVERRHHVLEKNLQNAVRAAARRAGVDKAVTPHVFRTPLVNGSPKSETGMCNRLPAGADRGHPARVFRDRKKAAGRMPADPHRQDVCATIRG